MSEGNGAPKSRVHNVYGGLHDPLIAARLAANEAVPFSLSREMLDGQLLDPRRDVDRECGYPQTGSGIPIRLYKDLYDREAIACRIVEVMPEQCWQVSPKVYETEDAEDKTQFEQDWDDLPKSLRGESSTYQDQESDSQGNPIYEYLKRLHVQAGIGSFGLLLFGINDGKDFSEPVEEVVEALTNNVGDCWMTETEEATLNKLGDDVPQPSGDPFDDFLNLPTPVQPLNDHEKQVVTNMARQREVTVNRLKAEMVRNKVATAEELAGDKLGPGYYAHTGIGQDSQYWDAEMQGTESPKKVKGKRKLLYLRVYDESLIQIVRYEWNRASPRFGMPVMYRITLNDPKEVHGGLGLPLATVMVHWSRVLHLALTLRNSETFSVPELRPVLNHVLALRKVYAADGEASWKNAFAGISFETHPQLGGDVVVDKAGLRRQVSDYQNNLTRTFFLSGMTAKQLPPSVNDPSPHVQIHIEAICIQKAQPVRIFKGSERGELASAQDDGQWNDTVRGFQNGLCTPKILVPFVERCIMMRLLSKPSVWHVKWPDLDSLTNKDKAGILLQRTQSIVAFVSGGGEQLMPAQDYLTREMGYSKEEAEEILDAAEQAEEDKMAADQALADEHGMVPTPPEGFQHPPEPPQVASPVKIKGGESLVHPETGQTVAKGPPLPKPTANFGDEEDDVTPSDNAFCPTGEGGGVDPTCAPGSSSAGGSFEADFDKAFASLDKHNFVSMVDLRKALPQYGKEQLNAELRKLRLARKYTMSAAEGRHGISQEERDAGIKEADQLMLFVHKRKD